MRDDFRQYVNSIGITTETSLSRIDAVLSKFLIIMPNEPIKRIFVSEYIQGDGVRVYENLWAITDKYLVEAKNYMLRDDLDILGYRNAITWAVFRSEEYDYITTNDKSRLHLVIRVGFNDGSFKASSGNCDVLLKSLYREFFWPNVVTPNADKER